jgi:hypothetical protein
MQYVSAGIPQGFAQGYGLRQRIAPLFIFLGAYSEYNRQMVPHGFPDRLYNLKGKPHAAFQASAVLVFALI